MCFIRPAESISFHDTNRLVSHIVNKDIAPYRKWGQFFNVSKAENSKYKVQKPTAADREVQKLIVFFQMTYLGTPMVYYGDEAGMWGANDPCCRKPMVWDNMKYDDEIYLPDQSKHPADKVEFDKDLFEYYKKIISIRNSHPALQLGEFRTILADDKNAVYVFERKYNNETILVALNNSREEKTIEIPSDKSEYKDVWNDKEYSSNGSIKINLGSLSGSILVKE